VDDYATAQIQSLKVGLLAVTLLALMSLAFTKDLPHEKPTAPDARAETVAADL
jgi:hypothetical protein